MSEAFRWLAALPPPLLLGLGLVLLLAPRGSRIAAGRVLAWSILLGAAALSLLHWAGALVARGAALRLTLALLGLAVAAMGLRRARRHAVTVDWTPPRTRAEWALAAAIALELVAVAGVSFRTRLSWDALVAAETQARPAWMRAESAPAPAADGDGRPARLGRAELLPALEAWCFGWLGRADQRAAKALLLAFGVAAAALFWSAAREDPRWMLAPLLAFAVPQLVAFPGSATSGDPDFALAVVYLACLMSLLAGSEGGGGGRILAALAAALLLIEPRGLLLWLTVVALAAWCAGGDRLRTALRVAMPGLVLLLIGARAFLHAPGVAAGAVSSWPALGEAVDLAHWGVFWPLLLLAVPRCLPREHRGDQRLLWAGILAPLALQYAAAVTLGGRWALSMHRLLVPSTLPAMLALSAVALSFSRWARREVLPHGPSGAPAMAVSLALCALPGMEQTARAAAEAPRAAAGPSGTTDVLLGPLAAPSPTATLRGLIDAMPARNAVLYVGAGNASREMGRVVALLAAPRPFAGWLCAERGVPARPLRARQPPPEADGLVVVYRPMPPWDDWMPLRPGENLWAAPPRERYRISPPPALCDPVVTRGQAAVLLSRLRHQGEAPTARPRGVFRDVPREHAAAAAVEELYATGAIQGCHPQLFCPDVAVTRAQMVLFALALHGARPPPARGLFADVAAGLAPYIERAHALGVRGCADDPPRFCPDRPVREPDLPAFLPLAAEPPR